MADTFRLRFAEKLRQLAKANDWPGNGQVQFAALVTERSGVAMRQPRISDLLRGNRQPSLQEVEMIALALGVSPGWLAFDGKQERVSHPRTQSEPKTHVLTPAEKVAAARKERRG